MLAVEPFHYWGRDKTRLFITLTVPINTDEKLGMKSLTRTHTHFLIAYTAKHTFQMVPLLCVSCLSHTEINNILSGKSSINLFYTSFFNPLLSHSKQGHLNHPYKTLYSVHSNIASALGLPRPLRFNRDPPKQSLDTYNYTKNESNASLHHKKRQIFPTCISWQR